MSEIDAFALHLLARTEILAVTQGKFLRIINLSPAVLAFLEQSDLEDFFCDTQKVIPRQLAPAI